MSPPLIQGRSTPSFNINSTVTGIDNTTEPVFGEQSSGNAFKVLKPITEEVTERLEDCKVGLFSAGSSKTLDVHKRTIPAGAKPIGVVVQSTRSRSPILQTVANSSGLKLLSPGDNVSRTPSVNTAAMASNTSSGLHAMYNPRLMQKYVVNRSKSPNLAAGIASSLTAGTASSVIGTASGVRNVITTNSKSLIVRSNRHSVSGTDVQQRVANSQEGNRTPCIGQKKSRSLSTSTMELPSADRIALTSSQVFTVQSTSGVRTVVPANCPTQSRSASLSSLNTDGEDILIHPQTIINAGATVTPLQRTTSRDNHGDSNNIPQLDGLADEKQQSSQEANLREKVVQKIKAESLARRSPVDHSPVKCKNCKRVYRTLESFNIHMKTCDFVVSSDEEEEEVDESVDDDNGDGDYMTGETRMRHQRASMSTSDTEWTPEDETKGKGRRKKSPSKTTKGGVKKDMRRRSRSTSLEKTEPNRGKERLMKSPVEMKGNTPYQVKKDKSTSQDTAGEPHIMYQGVKLIKPPFKRGRGRPRKMRPVLVVPPQRREQPQEEVQQQQGMDSEEEDEDLEDEYDDMEQETGQEVMDETGSVLRMSETVSQTVSHKTEASPKDTTASIKDIKKSSPPTFVASATARSATTTRDDIVDISSIAFKRQTVKSPTLKQQGLQQVFSDLASPVANVQCGKKESPTLKSKFHSPPLGHGERRLSESPQVERVSPFQVVRPPATYKRPSLGEEERAHIPLIPKPVALLQESGSKPQEGSDSDDCIIIDSEPEELPAKKTVTMSSQSVNENSACASVRTTKPLSPSRSTINVNLPEEIKKTLERLGKSVKSVRVVSKTPLPDQTTSHEPLPQGRLISVSQPVVVKTVNKGVQKYSSKTAETHTTAKTSPVSSSSNLSQASISPLSTGSSHVTRTLASAQPIVSVRDSYTCNSHPVFRSNNGASVIKVTSSQDKTSPSNLKHLRASTAITTTVASSPALCRKPTDSSVNKQADVSNKIAERQAVRSSGVVVSRHSPGTSPKRAFPKVAPINLRSMLLEEGKPSKVIAVRLVIYFLFLMQTTYENKTLVSVLRGER